MIKKPSKKQVKEWLQDGTLIKQFDQMVHNIAHDMIEDYPEETYQELVAEGFWGIIKYTPKYDPEKASLSTWMYTAIWGHMKNMCINKKKHRHIPSEFKTVDSVYVEPWSITFLRELSEEASFLANLVLEAPGELSGVMSDASPQTSRRSLRRYLKKNTNWSERKVKQTWREISECLA